MQKAHALFGIVMGIGCFFIGTVAVYLGYTNDEILIVLLMAALALPAFAWMLCKSSEQPPYTASRIRELESLCQEQSEWIQAHMEQAIRYAQQESEPAVPIPAVERKPKWEICQDYSGGPCRLEWNNGYRLGSTSSWAATAVDWLNRRTEIEAQLSKYKRDVEAMEAIRKYRMHIDTWSQFDKAEWRAGTVTRPVRNGYDQRFTDPAEAVLALAAQLDQKQS